MSGSCLRAAMATLLLVSGVACFGPAPRVEPTRPPSQPAVVQTPPATPQPSSTYVNGLADVAVSNVRENAFAVSWLSERVMTGIVRYGPDGGEALGTVAERPIDGALGLVHYVFLGHDTGATLAPEKKYWFEIVSGDGGASLFKGSVTTGRTLDFPPAAGGSLFGRIDGRDGKPAAGAVVLASISAAAGASAPLSTVTNERGEWALVIQNARTADLARLLTFQCGDRLDLQVLGGPTGRVRQSANVCDRPPLPTIALP